MKHTLLATTALVAITGAAAAEITVSGSARIGLQTTEGFAAASAVLEYATTTANMVSTYDIFGAGIIANSIQTDTYNTTTTAQTLVAVATGVKILAADITALDVLIAEVEARILKETNSITKQATVETLRAIVQSTAEQTQMTTDLATMKSLRGQMVKTTTAAKVLTADTTDSRNRMRVTFTGSGETDSGISFGGSMRADNAAGAASGTGGTAGTQYISGAFGKVTMGDLGGADKDAAGNIAGVGLTGLSDTNEVSYQGKDHNIGYSYTAAGLSFGYSQDTTVKSGSNSALGLKWTGDMGGTSMTVGLGQSKVGTATQSTVSLAMSTGGLTIKGITSTNDNGPAVVFAAGTSRNGTGATAYVADTEAVDNNDTDTTGVSISYSMDAMSVTAFTKKVETTGVTDKDYSGFGFAYDMGGVSLKAGVVDNNDQQLVDFGLSFNF